MLEKRLANWTATPSASQGSHVKDPGPSYFSSDLAAADFIPHWPPSAPRVLVLQWTHKNHLVEAVSCWSGKDDVHSQCLLWQNARMTLPRMPSPLLSFLGPSVRYENPEASWETCLVIEVFTGPGLSVSTLTAVSFGSDGLELGCTVWCLEWTVRAQH